jgi:hypothetical protein
MIFNINIQHRRTSATSIRKYPVTLSYCIPGFHRHTNGCVYILFAVTVLHALIHTAHRVPSFGFARSINVPGSTWWACRLCTCFIPRSVPNLPSYTVYSSILMVPRAGIKVLHADLMDQTNCRTQLKAKQFELARVPILPNQP